MVLLLVMLVCSVWEGEGRELLDIDALLLLLLMLLLLFKEEGKELGLGLVGADADAVALEDCWATRPRRSMGGGGCFLFFCFVFLLEGRGGRLVGMNATITNKRDVGVRTGTHTHVRWFGSAGKEGKQRRGFGEKRKRRKGWLVGLCTKRGVRSTFASSTHPQNHQEHRTNQDSAHTGARSWGGK